MAKPQTVSQYIAQAPRESRARLREMRACLKALTPDATESLKWGIPSFSYRRILYAYAGFKHHIGFYPTPSALKEFKDDLSNYRSAKGSVQFPLDKPLPRSLIKKMARFRIRESQEKDARWM